MKKILIVEDDPAIRLALEAGLTEDHYDVLLASDGIDGLKQAKNPMVDLILLDIMLPGKDGMEICAELRKEGITTDARNGWSIRLVQFGRAPKDVVAMIQMLQLTGTV